MLLAIISVAGNCQAFVQMGAGLNPNAGVPTVELFGGGVFRQSLVLAAGFQSHTTHVKDKACLFQGRIGIQVKPSETVVITPYFGATQLYRSSDNKSLNEVRPLFALEISQQMRVEEGKVYAGASLSGKLLIVSVGIRFSFTTD